MSKPVTIVCTVDQTKFQTDAKTLEKSKFIKNMLEEYNEESEIELPDIKGPVMKLILEWLQKHKDEEPKKPPQPLRTYDIKAMVGEWEDAYIEKVYNNSYDSLFEFLNAVNFLDIPLLLQLGAAKTACLIKDYTPDEFKELFQIEEDCTEEDVKKIEEEVLKEREEEREKERKRQEEEENNREEEEEEKKKKEEKETEEANN